MSHTLLLHFQPMPVLPAPTYPRHFYLHPILLPSPQQTFISFSVLMFLQFSLLILLPPSTTSLLLIHIPANLTWWSERPRPIRLTVLTPAQNAEYPSSPSKNDLSLHPIYASPHPSFLFLSFLYAFANTCGLLRLTPHISLLSHITLSLCLSFPSLSLSLLLCMIHIGRRRWPYGLGINA